MIRQFGGSIIRLCAAAQSSRCSAVDATSLLLTTKWKYAPHRQMEVCMVHFCWAPGSRIVSRPLQKQEQSKQCENESRGRMKETLPSK
jgi:hypothetical protein